jgi:hypothetical protein
MTKLDWIRTNVKTVEGLFDEQGLAAFPRDGSSFFTFTLYWDKRLREGGPQDKAIFDLFESRASGHGDIGILDAADKVFHKIQDLMGKEWA